MRMGVGTLEQAPLVVVEVAVTRKQTLAHRALDRVGSDWHEAPRVPDEHRLDMLGSVDQEGIDGPADKSNDVPVLADQRLERVKRIAIIGQERPEALQAAWSWNQRLRTELRLSYALPGRCPYYGVTRRSPARRLSPHRREGWRRLA